MGIFLRRSFVLVTVCTVASSTLFAQAQKVRTPRPKRSPVSVSMFSIANIGLREAARTNTGPIRTYNYLSLNYKFSRKQKLALRPAFTYSSSALTERGQTLASETALADFIISYNQYDVANWGGIRVSPELKLYLPMSEKSREHRTIAYTELSLAMRKKFAHGYSLNYYFKPRYYFQSQETYEVTFDDGNTTRRTTDNYRYKQYFEFSKSLTPSFALQGTLGDERKWSHSSQEHNKPVFQSHQSIMAMGMMFNPNRTLRLLVQMENRQDIFAPRESFAFREDNTQYSILTWLYF